MTSLRLRSAGPGDAERVARLHADSWRRHYRGAYSDSFLAGDVAADRLAVWSARLSAQSGSLTLLAQEEGVEILAGFVHVVFDEDRKWGSLVDNLHVVHGRQRGGIGTVLLRRAAAAASERALSDGVYLWVLEQNTAAQQFYRAMGGSPVQKAVVAPPGGVPGRLNGSPNKLRFVWPEAAKLALAGEH
ncbi:GNAT family N-acetyltransferase [Actinocrinis puniceicyclus]|uniref:GNAT family N-acetyltransferase n=1 Tax=Actinocrinis puniceicyclus TaxID=977794 RepID=A0A8J8BF75_9ACTN|nr:GNAT family N-acetyltransferase [Actinocrinis puniceicyclus]MBS2966355.1 GNAT family N-acetyltransferase [Actinocrinis puniceicyclus]